MEANPGRLQFKAPWIARSLVSVGLLASIWLITQFLLFAWELFSSDPDFPPTWFLSLTILLTVADVLVLCYSGFQIIRVASGKSALWRVLKTSLLLIIALAMSHLVAAYAYSRIPMWDFQGNLFDDLSWRHVPGSISQDCRNSTNQSTYPGATVLPSPAPYLERPTTYEEIQRIAWTPDLQTRYNELANRTVVGWRGWIQDLTRHGYYSNPEHRLVTLFLHDPYSNDSVRLDDQLTGINQQPEAILSYFDSSEVDKLTVGQEVLLCGRISDATVNDDGVVHISIDEPVVHPLPLPEILTTTQIPTDFALEYEAHGCGDGYECAEYDLRIDADGNLTYRGLANVPITGTHTTQILRDKLKQLVFELQRTKLLMLDSLPERLEGNPKGATVIRARLDGTSKSIVLPWRAMPWPASAIMVIGKIEEVSNLQQWVKMVKSP